MPETEQEKRLISRDTQQAHECEAAEISPVADRLQSERAVSHRKHRGCSADPSQDQNPGGDLLHNQLPRDGETRHEGLDQDQHEMDDAASLPSPAATRPGARFVTGQGPQRGTQFRK